MTEVEERFYKEFEIKPATVKEYGAYYFWNTIEINGKRYTPINDRILLNLIACINKEIADKSADAKPISISGFSYEGVKESIVKESIKLKDNIKTQVQSLFTEA